MMRRTFFALALLLIGSGAWYVVSSAESGADPISLEDVGLDAACDRGLCPIRVVITQGGRRMMSAPLPFDAVSAEIEPTEMSEMFGHLLPGQAPREVAAWSVGPDEEKAVGVAVEVAETGVAGPVLIVHQAAGRQLLQWWNRALVRFPLTGRLYGAASQIVHYISSRSESLARSIGIAASGFKTSQRANSFISPSAIDKRPRISIPADLLSR